MRYHSFNQYLKKRFGERVQKVTLDAGLGCPNRDGTKGWGGCIYCDQFGSGTGATERYPDLKSQAQAGMEQLARRYKARKFIAYLQSFTNTYAPVETLRSLYDEAVQLPNVVGLAVGTRADCITREVLELLSQYTPQLMVWLELGLQSVHDETLHLINRGHTYGDFLEGYALAREYPLLICLHVIIGLPGEQRNHILTTAQEVARLTPDGLKIHALYINKGTRLEKLFRDEKYTPLKQQEFIALTCDFLEVVSPDVVIQRLTGDPRRRELVAPDWALRKQQTLSLITKGLEERGTYQGSKWQGKLRYLNFVQQG